MNLQETIRKILREDYSPAGKEITPNDIVVHKSNPIWRKNILETGLQVSVGECYKTYVGYGENVNQQYLQPTQQTKEPGLIQHTMMIFGLLIQQRSQM